MGGRGASDGGAGGGGAAMRVERGRVGGVGGVPGRFWRLRGLGSRDLTGFGSVMS